MMCHTCSKYWSILRLYHVEHEYWLETARFEYLSCTSFSSEEGGVGGCFAVQLNGWYGRRMVLQQVRVTSGAPKRSWGGYDYPAWHGFRAQEEGAATQRKGWPRSEFDLEGATGSMRGPAACLIRGSGARVRASGWEVGDAPRACLMPCYQAKPDPQGSVETWRKGAAAGGGVWGGVWGERAPRTCPGPLGARGRGPPARAWACPGAAPCAAPWAPPPSRPWGSPTPAPHAAKCDRLGPRPGASTLCAGRRVCRAELGGGAADCQATAHGQRSIIAESR